MNGAQTSSTISQHLKEHPVDDSPIWVVAKIVTVDEKDIDRARLLTKTSNTQTPASNKDLRAVDVSHRRIAEWMSRRYGLTYSYRRGVRAPRGVTAVPMKDLAQAFVAFELRQPHIPFARVGTILSQTDLYNSTFEPDLVELVRQAGNDQDEREYIARRLMPYRIALAVRGYIDDRIRNHGEDPKWRSSTDHLVWVYREMLDRDELLDPVRYLDRTEDLVEQSIQDVYRAFKQAANYGGLHIPRDLKSTKMVDHLVLHSFVDEDDSIADARSTVRNACN